MFSNQRDFALAAANGARRLESPLNRTRSPGGGLARFFPWGRVKRIRAEIVQREIAGTVLTYYVLELEVVRSYLGIPIRSARLFISPYEDRLSAAAAEWILAGEAPDQTIL